VAGFAPAEEGFFPAVAGFAPLEERLVVVADLAGAAARVAARAGVALAGARAVRFLAGDAADFERPTDLGAFAVPI
jgi:hypothetical protein